MIDKTLHHASTRAGGLTFCARAMLTFLHGEIVFERWTPLKQQWIGAVFGLSKNRVSETLKELSARGYLERGPFDPTAGVFVYRLSRPAPSITVPVIRTDRAA